MPDFRDDAKLDTSQVEDLRGRRRVKARAGSRSAVGGGIALVVTLLIIFLGGGGNGLPSDLGDLAGQTAGPRRRTATSRRSARPAPTPTSATTAGSSASSTRSRRYWTDRFRRRRARVRARRTRFFTDAVHTGCGVGLLRGGAVLLPGRRAGLHRPRLLRRAADRFGAPGGPFAEAYVIAHEYGHHVQNLLGVLDRASRRRHRRRAGAVRVELQADCFAGRVGAQRGRDRVHRALTEADIADGLDAAGRRRRRPHPGGPSRTPRRFCTWCPYSWAIT